MTVLAAVAGGLVGLVGLALLLTSAVLKRRKVEG